MIDKMRLRCLGKEKDLVRGAEEKILTAAAAEWEEEV